nr:ribonuclease H-like domain-containing protein [Tanacetum cinerariifolium]
TASDGTGKKKGRTVTLTADDMQKRKNDVKARTTLLLSLPDEHQLRFSKYKTAQELWATILKTFGSNEATKKTKKNLLKQQYGNFKAKGSETLEQTFNRLQVIISQLQFMDVEIKHDDLNKKFLTSLAPEWLMHTIVWRNRSDLDTMSLDDLYNHLKVYESEVQKKSELNSQNMAFISSAKHSRGHEEVNTASTNVSTASANIEIDEDDMEEMDIKWNMALLSMRADRFWKKTRKKIRLPEARTEEGETTTYKGLKLKNRLQKRFQTASKDLDSLLESQRLDKNKEGLGYSAVPPPPAQIYSLPKKDMTWTGLPECADDTTEASPSTISPKPFIKFVKANDSPAKSKTYKVETAKKPPVKYAEQYRKPTKKPNVRGNIRNWNNLKSHQLECIVLGQNFKLSDDDNVLLWTPRQHNMYSIDLNNIVPHKDLTCLVAKASANECMLWHKRLGHLNFKTMNRCDNGGEFRNKEMDDFCSQKGIKREFSNARTPQQNDVVERRNKTLIEAARIILADAKLPVTFWAEAVNTACYVQNRVLVNKSHNKTQYELFNGRSPAIGFLKPFGCHVMILNTLDHLGKFEAKLDKCYFIGYAMSSKAFRVFNKRTKRVEENLHVEFLENKAIEKGTYSTNFSSIKVAASQEVKKDVSSLRYIALSNWVHDALLESSSSKPQDDCSTDVHESSGNSNPTATSTNPSADHMETLTVKTPIPTVSSPVPTACFTDSQEPLQGRD